MPPILNQLAEYGVIGLLMFAVVYITIMLIKRMPNKGDSEVTKTLRDISDSLMAHTERAIASQELTLKNFSIVLHDHERMLDSISRVIMAISVQDKVIERFQTDVADIKCALSQISKRQYEVPR